MLPYFLLYFGAYINSGEDFVYEEDLSNVPGWTAGVGKAANTPISDTIWISWLAKGTMPS